MWCETFAFYMLHKHFSKACWIKIVFPLRWLASHTEFSECSMAWNKRACRKIKEERITLIDTWKTRITTALAQAGEEKKGRESKWIRDLLSQREKERERERERTPAKYTKSPAPAVPSLRDDEGRIKERAWVRSFVIFYSRFISPAAVRKTRPVTRTAVHHRAMRSRVQPETRNDASRHCLWEKKN